MKTVTLLIPCYNEEEALPHFYKKIQEVVKELSNSYRFEFLFINDGSSDKTLDILRKYAAHDNRVRCIDMSRNYGKEIGMLAGFDHASGDCVITIDADLQEPPELISEMLSEWENGASDVYGRRRHRSQSIAKKASSRFYHKLLSNVSDVELSDDAGDFRLLDRKCVNALKSMRESQRYTKGMYDWIGFRKTPVDYDISPRIAGSTKWTLPKLIHLAADGIMSHSVMPLRLASFAGMIISICAFIYLAYVVIKSICWGDRVAGYPSLMAVILFLGGFILLALGIIGEYLGRIFLETKHRPVYFVNEVIGQNADNNTRSA
ncbi:MAG: glycosyltransferase family 2 protein [Prevotella sp.]|nr:glycosyltransferase family 2 protein [Bacteroides sp.]MCM1366644.1 glycosyltransferase family 2 protein [Prevotella sp.]MCM1437009.1 glycosyltransferase family 2 protein [Prevotella sp.]